MSLAGGWLLAPALLALLCCGCGLLAERVAGLRVAGALVPALGLAVVVVVAGIATTWDATAELATPLVAGVAIGGLVLGRPWADARLRGAWPWPLLAALGAYALFSAPSLLTGQGSITGYVKLDDSATWLALTDHVMSHGRDLDGLAVGSYTQTLHSWLGGDYPVGAFMPLGVGAQISGQDVAGIYQPLIALAAVILALGLMTVARDFVRSPALAAGCAIVAVQASLFLGYTQWGGIKEAITAALLPPLVVVAMRAGGEQGARFMALAALLAGALLGVLGVNGLAWAGPALLVGTVLWLRPLWPRVPIAGLAACAALLALASLPALVSIDFFRNTTEGAISAQEDLGNLTKPLPLLQGAGLWPVGDFRFDPDPRGLAVVLALAVLLAVIAACVLAIAQRRLVLPALVGVAVAGAIPAVAIGAPWIDSKALAVVSPMLLLGAAALAARALEDPRPQLWGPGLAGAVVLALGCGWSTALVVRDVFVAPRERLAELHELAPLVAGRGPTLVLDFEIYADRHFLRDADPEGATDLRYRPVRRRDGEYFPDFVTAEVDEVATPDLWVYRTLVRRRSPVASRPPSAFRLRAAGKSFEVWERDPPARPPLARMPLGDPRHPSAVPDCKAIASLSRTPGLRSLAAVARPGTAAASLERGAPPQWRTGYGVAPLVDGQGAVELDVPRSGRWRVWVGGATLGRLELAVDGRAVGSKRHELSHPGQWLAFGALDLQRGPHSVTFEYKGGRAGRGRTGAQPALGPLALSPVAEEGDLPVTSVPPNGYRRLCDGRRYDWIEALG